MSEIQIHLQLIPAQLIAFDWKNFKVGKGVPHTFANAVLTLVLYSFDYGIKAIFSSNISDDCV